MAGDFTINKQQAAYLLDTTERTLTTWQNRAEDPLPVLAKGKRGQANEYNPQALLHWKLRQEMNRLTMGEDGELIDYERERARLTREQADNTALKNAQLRKELAPVAVIEWVLGKVGTQISSVLEAIPLKVKRRVPKLTSAEVEIIKREVTKAQNMAARVTVDLDEYIADLGTESRDREGDPARPAGT